MVRADLTDVVTTIAAPDEVNEYAEPLARTLRLPFDTVPLLELKRELFTRPSAEIGRRVQRQGLSDRDVEVGFESWRKTRHAKHCRN